MRRLCLLAIPPTAAVFSAVMFTASNAEPPIPDTTTPQDKIALVSRQIGISNCQDRAQHPCLIQTNTEYHVSAHADGNKFFNFRFVVPEGITVATFRYTSSKYKPDLDIAYSDDMTEYVHEIIDFPTTTVIYPFSVGKADPDTPRSHNYYGRLIPTDYLITIRDFPDESDLDFTFEVDVATP